MQGVVQVVVLATLEIILGRALELHCQMITPAMHVPLAKLVVVVLPGHVIFALQENTLQRLGWQHALRVI